MRRREFLALLGGAAVWPLRRACAAAVDTGFPILWCTGPRKRRTCRGSGP